jgi:hypothetical protein
VAAVSAEGSTVWVIDPALELRMESFDRIGGRCVPPLAGRQSDKGEEPITGFLEAVGHRLAFEPPFAGKGPPPHLDLLRRRGADQSV